MNQKSVLVLTIQGFTREIMRFLRAQNSKDGEEDETKLNMKTEINERDTSHIKFKGMHGLRVMLVI